MGQPWPELLRIGRDQLTLLEAILVAETPRESCALLLGPWSGPQPCREVGLRIEAIWPCLNVWDPPAERPRRFAVDPREQLLAQKWGRLHGWQLIGTAHSHPGGVAVPSELDRSLAFPPTLMLIAGATAELGPASVATPIRAWWLAPAGVPEPALALMRPLAMRIGDLGH
ncbi:M67 family metallopeptidase [Synechococcus sp. Tobar12-5m-g]|uniref:M67 family metallopeptidase n=1 Tax=unclassified Synechococcus TaxID=2626047 RepID=UPI0020CE10D2|nr:MULTISPECIES: M67 family metallopeptidase [unclassified Synechococcus]MCP9772996.1 M67 family metallopeptidase [Synechococcus sp. Tobar12-5m-g]MCP9873855.1 M67 family metallopeptidase [Synechococcus sp. Cruz CV-v-12]